MNPIAVSLDDITKSYTLHKELHTVLDSVSFTVPQGQRVALLGPNGSGKSTLLKIILKILEPDFGKVEIHDTRFAGRISYIPQDYRNSLFPWMTMRANLALYLQGSDFAAENGLWNQIFLSPTQEMVNEFSKVANQVKLQMNLHKYPYQLSGGEQQIFVLLQAMLRKPNLLVLDEPFSAVDFYKKAIIMEHLTAWLMETAPSVIFVSHDIGDALFLADRVIVLSRRTGKISADFHVNKTHPRKDGWREDLDFQDLQRKVAASFNE